MWCSVRRVRWHARCWRRPSACPTITIDGAQQPMTIRALPDATFPVLVCERPIPAGVTSASVENLPLPLPKAPLKSIAAFGDPAAASRPQKQRPRAVTPPTTRTGASSRTATTPRCGRSRRYPGAWRTPSPTSSSTSATTSTARAPARRTTPAVRVALLATIGQPGRRIFSRLRHRHYSRHPGSSCAAITRSAAVPGGVISGCSTRRPLRRRRLRRRLAST